MWRGNLCLTLLSEGLPGTVTPTTLCLSHTARKADLQSCLRPWKGKTPILIPWAIPPQPKHHPQTSVCLSLHLLEPLAVLSLAVTSLSPDCLQTFYRGAPGVDVVTNFETVYLILPSASHCHQLYLKIR